MNVLCLSGQKRSGKDTACALITELLEASDKKVKRVALADTMKEITSKLFNIDVDEVNIMKDDENIMIGKLTKHNDLAPYDIDVMTTMRGVLQQLGQHLKSYFGNNVWFDLACQKIQDEDTLYIITDIRFPFELDNFQTKFNARSIKINRDTGMEQDLHESEAFINDIVTDWTVDNNGTLEEFKEHLREILLANGYL